MAYDYTPEKQSVEKKNDDTINRAGEILDLSDTKRGPNETYMWIEATSCDELWGLMTGKKKNESARPRVSEMLRRKGEPEPKAVNRAGDQTNLPSSLQMVASVGEVVYVVPTLHLVAPSQFLPAGRTVDFVHQGRPCIQKTTRSDCRSCALGLEGRHAEGQALVAGYADSNVSNALVGQRRGLVEETRLGNWDRGVAIPHYGP